MVDDKNKIGALNILMNNYYRISNLSYKELEDMETIIWLYIEKWCRKEFSNHERGDDVAVLTPGAREIQKKIYERGRRDILSNILSNNISIEETAKLTGLSIEEISAIVDSE